MGGATCTKSAKTIIKFFKITLMLPVLLQIMIWKWGLVYFLQRVSWFPSMLLPSAHQQQMLGVLGGGLVSSLLPPCAWTQQSNSFTGLCKSLELPHFYWLQKKFQLYWNIQRGLYQQFFRLGFIFNSILFLHSFSVYVHCKNELLQLVQYIWFKSMGLLYLGWLQPIFLSKCAQILLVNPI